MKLLKAFYVVFGLVIASGAVWGIVRDIRGAAGSSFNTGDAIVLLVNLIVIAAGIYITVMAVRIHVPSPLILNSNQQKPLHPHAEFSQAGILRKQ